MLHWNHKQTLFCNYMRNPASHSGSIRVPLPEAVALKLPNIAHIPHMLQHKSWKIIITETLAHLFKSWGENSTSWFSNDQNVSFSEPLNLGYSLRNVQMRRTFEPAHVRDIYFNISYMSDDQNVEPRSTIGSPWQEVVIGHWKRLVF